MALIEKEIEELRSLLKLFDRRKITQEELHARIEVYSQVEKRERLLLMAQSMVNKYKASLTRLVKSNLIGDMAAIDIGEDYQTEKIKCPLEEEKIIMRQECLDLSGQGKNHDICKECVNFTITRELLLGEE